MASDLHSQKGIDQKFLELGEPGDCQEDETEFKIRLFICEHWKLVFDWVSQLLIFPIIKERCSMEEDRSH